MPSFSNLSGSNVSVSPIVRNGSFDSNINSWNVLFTDASMSVSWDGTTGYTANGCMKTMFDSDVMSVGNAIVGQSIYFESNLFNRNRIKFSMRYKRGYNTPHTPGTITDMKVTISAIMAGTENNRIILLEDATITSDGDWQLLESTVPHVYFDLEISFFVRGTVDAWLYVDDVSLEDYVGESSDAPQNFCLDGSPINLVKNEQDLLYGFGYVPTDSGTATSPGGSVSSLSDSTKIWMTDQWANSYVVFPRLNTYKTVTGTTYPDTITWSGALALVGGEVYNLLKPGFDEGYEYIGYYAPPLEDPDSDWGGSLLVGENGDLYIAGTSDGWSGRTTVYGGLGYDGMRMAFLIKKGYGETSPTWQRVVRSDYPTYYAGGVARTTGIVGNMIFAPDGDIILAYASGGNGPTAGATFSASYPPSKENYGGQRGRVSFMKISADGDLIKRQRYRPQPGYTRSSWASSYDWSGNGNNWIVAPRIGYVKSGNTVEGYLAIGTTNIYGFTVFGMLMDLNLDDSPDSIMPFKKKVYLDLQGFVGMGSGPLAKGLDCVMRDDVGYMAFGVLTQTGLGYATLLVKTDENLDVPAPYKENVCDVEYVENSYGYGSALFPKNAMFDSDNSLVIVGDRVNHCPYYTETYATGSSSAQDEFHLEDNTKAWSAAGNGEHAFRTVKILSDGTTWNNKTRIVMPGGTTATAVWWASASDVYNMLQPTPQPLTYSIVDGGRFAYCPCLTKIDVDTFEKTLEVTWHLLFYEGTVDSVDGPPATYLQVAGNPWVNNQWDGCRVLFTSGTNTNRSRRIGTTTTNRLYWDGPAYPSSPPLADPAHGDTFKIVANQCWSGGGVCQVPGSSDYLCTFSYRNPNSNLLPPYKEDEFAVGVLRCGPDGEVKWATKVPRSASSQYSYSSTVGKILVSAKNGRAFIAAEDAENDTVVSGLLYQNRDLKINEIDLDGTIIGGCSESLTFEPAIHSDEIEIYNYATSRDFGTPYTYDNGNSTAGSTTSLTDTGPPAKSWTVDQWKGYVVRVSYGGNYVYNREITSNTATTLNWDVPFNFSASGRAYKILAGRCACAAPPPWFPYPDADVTDAPHSWGAANGGTLTTLVDTSQTTWTTNQWAGRILRWSNGPNMYEERTVTSSTGFGDTPKCTLYFSGSLPVVPTGYRYYLGISGNRKPWFGKDCTLDSSPIYTAHVFPKYEGVATAVTTTSLTDERASFLVSLVGYNVFISSSGGATGVRQITSNTANSVSWDVGSPLALSGYTEYSIKISENSPGYPPYPADYLSDDDDIMATSPIAICTSYYDPSTHLNSTMLVDSNNVYVNGILRSMNASNPCPSDSFITCVKKDVGTPTWTTTIKHKMEDGGYWKGYDSTDSDWTLQGDYWASATGTLVNTTSNLVLFLLGKKEDSPGKWYNRTAVLVFDKTDGALSNYRTWAINNGGSANDESEVATVHLNRSLQLASGAFLNIGKSHLKTGTTMATHLALMSVPATILTDHVGAISPTVKLARPETEYDDDMTFSDQAEVLDMREISPTQVRCVACVPMVFDHLIFYAFDVDPTTLTISNAKSFYSSTLFSDRMYISGASIASDGSFLVSGIYGGSGEGGVYTGGLLVSVAADYSILLSKQTSGLFYKATISNVKFSDVDEGYCYIAGNNFMENLGYLSSIKVSDFSASWGRHLNKSADCEAGLYKAMLDEDGDNLYMSDTVSTVHEATTPPVYAFKYWLGMTASDGSTSTDCGTFYDPATLTVDFTDGPVWTVESFVGLNQSSPVGVTESIYNPFVVATETIPTSFECLTIENFARAKYVMFTSSGAC